MKIALDVTQNLLEQFRRIFGAVEKGETSSLEMNPEVGAGRMDLLTFPGQLEIYHYWGRLRQPLDFTTTNPESSPWYGLNINLSDDELLRKIGGTEVAIQRHLPSGMLLYPPGCSVRGVSEAGQRLESVFIRFHRDFLAEYSAADFESLPLVGGPVLYEDLDYQSEAMLREILVAKSERLAAHAAALSFMGMFLDKLKARGSDRVAEQLDPQDLKGLFAAAAALRDPLARSVPSIDELAELARLGATKFKTSFRAVFGVAPHRYHHKIKLEYARDELLARRKRPSELSYELGYSHPSKFTAAFKKHFDQLPSQVRGRSVRR